MKTRSGTDSRIGSSYISASYCGIITGVNDEVRLSAEELESAFACGSKCRYGNALASRH